MAGQENEGGAQKTREDDGGVRTGADGVSREEVVAIARETEAVLLPDAVVFQSSGGGAGQL